MKIQIEDKEFSCFLEYEQIKKRTRLLGIQMNVDYEEKLPVVIAVLNGSFLFMADLVKELTVPIEVAFIKLSSYHGGESSSGVIKEVIGLDIDLQGRDVIIVEDIVDTGNTITHILKQLKEYNPASVVVCTLLLKPDALEVEVEGIAYVGFEIPDEFVVGYGLDYKGLGRNLKDIYRAIRLPSET